MKQFHLSNASTMRLASKLVVGRTEFAMTIRGQKFGDPGHKTIFL